MKDRMIRRQMYMPAWLYDFLEDSGELHNSSASEIARIHSCLTIISIAKRLYPSYKPRSTIKDLTSYMRRLSKGLVKDPNEIKDLFSEIYFEGRKAINILQKRKGLLSKKI